MPALMVAGEDMVWVCMSVLVIRISAESRCLFLEGVVEHAVMDSSNSAFNVVLSLLVLLGKEWWVAVLLPVLFVGRNKRRKRWRWVKGVKQCYINKKEGVLFRLC